MVPLAHRDFRDCPESLVTLVCRDQQDQQDFRDYPESLERPETRE
jgi:hypothetical protein